jgi:hypothetical protein
VKETSVTSHPYVRAYLAGIAVPTALLPVALAAFLAAHFGGVRVPVERLLVFPMAAVPNLWGLWNILYLVLRGRRWPIGAHGAALPFLLLPVGLALAEALGIPVYTPARVAIVFPVALAAYYLAWKHVVGFLNRLMGVES